MVYLLVLNDHGESHRGPDGLGDVALMEVGFLHMLEEVEIGGHAAELGAPVVAEVGDALSAEQRVDDVFHRVAAEQADAASTEVQGRETEDVVEGVATVDGTYEGFVAQVFTAVGEGAEQGPLAE